MKIAAEFHDLIRGLPGEEFAGPAMLDLERGVLDSPDALLFFIARTRIEEAGLHFLSGFAQNAPENPEFQLYRKLLEQNEETAYGRYTSMKRRLDSFIRALELRTAGLTTLAPRSE